MSGCFFFVSYWAIRVLQLFINQVVTWWFLKLTLLIKPFFLHDQKVMVKAEISWEERELLRWNKKLFPSFLKDFQWSKQQQQQKKRIGSREPDFKHLRPSKTFWGTVKKFENKKLSLFFLSGIGTGRVKVALI